VGCHFELQLAEMPVGARRMWWGRRAPESTASSSPYCRVVRVNTVPQGTLVGGRGSGPGTPNCMTVRQVHHVAGAAHPERQKQSRFNIYIYIYIYSTYLVAAPESYDRSTQVCDSRDRHPNNVAGLTDPMRCPPCRFAKLLILVQCIEMYTSQIATFSLHHLQFTLPSIKQNIKVPRRLLASLLHNPRSMLLILPLTYPQLMECSQTRENAST